MGLRRGFDECAGAGFGGAWVCESIKKRTEKRKEKREKRKMRYEQIQTMAQHFLSGKKNP